MKPQFYLNVCVCTCALGVLFEFARATNTFVSEPHNIESINTAKKLFDDITNIFSILRNKDGEEFPEEALALLNERSEARKSKNWARADEIREQLKEMGYAVEDSKDGAKLKKL